MHISFLSAPHSPTHPRKQLLCLSLMNLPTVRLAGHRESRNCWCLCCVRAKVLQSCPTLCNPMDHSPRGSPIHGILQARILEWVALSSSRGSSQPRDWTWVSSVSCIGRQVLYHRHPWEARCLCYPFYFYNSFSWIRTPDPYSKAVSCLISP